MRPKTAFLAPRGGQGTFVLTVVAYATFPTLRVPDAHGTPTHHTHYVCMLLMPHPMMIRMMITLTLRYIFLHHVTRGNHRYYNLFSYDNLAHGVVILTPQVTTTLAYVFHQE